MDGRLCSNSFDGAISLWNTETGVCEQSVVMEPLVLRLVQLSDGRICTGQQIFNLTTGVCELRLNTNSHHILKLNDDRIIFGYNRKIRVWNSITGVWGETFQGHDIWDMVLLFDGRLCSVSKDGSLAIWNIETGVCDVNIQVNSKGLFKALQLHDGRILVSDNEIEFYIIE
jgi:WD40 repeat protein